MATIKIRIDDADMGDTDGMDVQASMHKYCELVRGRLSAQVYGATLDIGWGSNEFRIEGNLADDAEEDCRRCDEVAELAQQVQNDVFAENEWVVEVD